MADTPVIYTERLILRPMAASDYDDFHEYFTQENVAEIVGCEPAANPGALDRIFQNNVFSPYTWAMMHNETGKVVGDIHFGRIVEGKLAHIGYILNNQFQGRGLMTEALLKVTEYGFSALGFIRIRAIIHATNQKSENILKRCGFQREALLRDGDFNGRLADLLYYSKATPDQ